MWGMSSQSGVDPLTNLWGFIEAWKRKQGERVERARAEFNYRSIEPHLEPGSRVLDVGAWNCYLGELLRDRLDCQVLSLDVVDANQTKMPFRIFDGKRLPAAPGSFDVVLLLYVLHHAADDEPLLREARRVVGETGRILVAEDNVDGLWNRALTVGFHGWLWMATRMGCDGRFRTTEEWRRRFSRFGLKLRTTAFLGHHLGKRMWPKNTFFVLEKG
jgi:SAM-dependent methyltransferase